MKTITCFDTKEVCRTYKDYLKSKHWKNKKKEYYDNYERKCNHCGSKNILHLHHKTYERVGYELLTDLVCLCSDCHAKEHRRLKNNPKKIKQKKKKFKGKNKKKIKRPIYKKPKAPKKKLEDLEKYKPKDPRK